MNCTSVLKSLLYVAGRKLTLHVQTRGGRQPAPSHDPGVNSGSGNCVKKLARATLDVIRNRGWGEGGSSKFPAVDPAVASRRAAAIKCAYPSTMAPRKFISSTGTRDRGTSDSLPIFSPFSNNFLPSAARPISHLSLILFAFRVKALHSARAKKEPENGSKISRMDCDVFSMS